MYVHYHSNACINVHINIHIAAELHPNTAHTHVRSVGYILYIHAYVHKYARTHDCAV